MKKKLAVKAGILTAVFIVAVIFFSYITNKGNTDLSADMGGAVLPRIVFSVGEEEVNSLPGYRSDMVMTTMRDTVVPVTNHQLEFKITHSNEEIQSLTWQIFTLNGEKCLQQENVKDVSGTKLIEISGDGIMDEERILKITLHLEKEDIYYYTRICDAIETNYEICLDFVEQLHTQILKKENLEELDTYLETTAAGDSSTYQNVTIHSTVTQLTWGELRPQMEGGVQWEILECNPAYTSVKLRYQVSCESEEENKRHIYSVKEFFKVRVVGDKTYLMDYDRETTENFTGAKGTLDEKGLNLGIVPLDLEYKNNSEGNIVSFVQNNELWNYDKEADEISLVFSFASAESIDVRHQYDHHKIRIVNVDKNGSTTFSVIGYMNRGLHEGQVGVAVYYFDAEKNSVEEKAFVPSKKGYDVMKNNLGKYVYYSDKDEKIYVMLDGSMYCVDLIEDTRKVLVRGLEEGQYKISEEGNLLAYQEQGGKLNASQKITVLNLKNGKTFSIQSQGDEYVKPIGFVKNDFAYGTMRSADLGTNVAGNAIYPMYKLQIVDQKQNIVKEYQIPDAYITNGYINGNMLTLNRVRKEAETYVALEDDYITNNAEEKESNITLENELDPLKGRVVKFIYEDGIQDTDAKLLKPKLVMTGKPINITFDESNAEGVYYVYALGELQGVYDNAGYAIQQAALKKGVAVNAKQAYLWEQGNRQEYYEVPEMEPFKAEDGESQIAACVRQMLKKEGRELDVSKLLEEGKTPEEILTMYTDGEGVNLEGCTLDQMLYLVNKGTPVMAMISENRAVLLISYNSVKVAYLDPSDGQRHAVALSTMESMTSAAGNMYIGYVK